MNITVEIKTIYGVDKIYPACEVSRTFAKIAGTKTLTIETLEHIKSLGVLVGVASTQSKLEGMFSK